MSEGGGKDQLTNLGFGTLNDVSTPIGGKRKRQSANSSFMDAVASSAQNQFDTNAIDNTGPYKAVVLRVEKPPGSAGVVGSWLAASIGAIFGAPPMVRVKARIPEIHAALPIPQELGSGDGPHQQIIDMYPTFTAQDTSLEEPKPGDIVNVDFGNKNRWTDPIYLGPLVKSKPGGGGGGSAAAGSAFGNCGSAFSPTTSAPSGDPLPGKNKEAAATGLPLQPRKKVEVGEYKLVNGEKGGFKDTTVGWDKATRAAKLPGTSWIGYLGGNDTATFGSGDSEHKSEDELRDTIIFVPNVTDVSMKTKVEVIVYLHDFNEFGIKSFESIAKTLKKMASSGRNFVLVMPELPWSQNTNTPNGRTDEGIDDYNEWYDNVMATLSSTTGASFEDGSKDLYVTVSAKGAGQYVVRNSSDTDEFHGTGMASSDAAQRLIVSISKGAIGGGEYVEMIDEWGAEVSPNDTECIFICNKSMVSTIESEVDALKAKLSSENPHNVIVLQMPDNVTISDSLLLTYVNDKKGKAILEKEAADKKEAEEAAAAEKAAKEEEAKEEAAKAKEEQGPPVQPEAQGPPAPAEDQGPPAPPSETPKTSTDLGAGNPTSQAPQGSAAGGGSIPGGGEGSPCVTPVGGSGGASTGWSGKGGTFISSGDAAAGGGWVATGLADMYVDHEGFWPTTKGKRAYELEGQPVGFVLVEGPPQPAKRYGHGKKPPKRKYPIKMYTVHETAGWPGEDGVKLANGLARKMRFNEGPPYHKPGGKTGTAVDYWMAQNGDIVHCVPLYVQSWHATVVNPYSVGNEMGSLSSTGKKVDRNNKHVKKACQYLIKPGEDGHLRPLPGYGLVYWSKGAMIPSEIQCIAMWNHILWLHKGADGIKGSEWLNLPIAFPAVTSEEFFPWGRVNPYNWWKKQKKVEGSAAGICAHIRWGHGDGPFGEFYCLGRAMGFSSADAYYAAVGAVASMGGKGKNITGHGKKTSYHPNETYVQMGRDTMRDAPLTVPYGSWKELDVQPFYFQPGVS